MSIDWTEDEHRVVAQGMADHGVETKRCAALARVVYKIAKTKDPNSRGIQIKAPPGARYLVPKKPHVPYWHSHTFVETMEHDVDAITGVGGYAAATYLNDHWHWPETFLVQEVDVATIDPGIKDTKDDER